MIFEVAILFVVTVFLIVYCTAKCCCSRSTRGSVIATPVLITSEVHRITPGTQAGQSVTIIQGHSTGTAAYPTAYAAQHTVQIPPLPPQLQYPTPPAAMPPPTGPAVGAAMVNPPSYDQVVSVAYPAQPPYNPNYSG
uniref:Uncharacterized protein n=1 Tax=Anopheles minimus TaxID=112268 RepID=A0A182WIP6_9DIPT